MKNKFKSIMNVVIDVVIVLFLICAALILVVSLSQKVEKPGSVSQIFGYTFRNIQSESMEAYDENGELVDGAYKKGDIVVFKITDRESYEVGETVLFRMPITRNADGSYQECDPAIAGDMILVTHNITEIIESEDGRTLYRTQGVNELSIADLNLKDADDILGIYTGVRLAGFGSFSNFVQSGLGFFLCIILPIAIFVIIQTIRVIRNFVAYKAQKAATAAASGELTDEQKRLIAEEYLKQQQAAEDDTASSTVDTADGE